MEKKPQERGEKSSAELLLFDEKHRPDQTEGDQADSLLLSSTDRDDPQKIRRVKGRGEYQTTRSEGRTFLEKKLDDAVSMIEQLRRQMVTFEAMHREQSQSKSELHSALVQVQQLQLQNRQLKERLMRPNEVTPRERPEPLEKLRHQLEATRQLTQRSQNGLVTELEEYHRALQLTTRNLSEVLQTEIYELKVTMESQERRIAQLTNENAELLEKRENDSSRHKQHEQSIQLKEQLSAKEIEHNKNLAIAQQTAQSLQIEMDRQAESHQLESETMRAQIQLLRQELCDRTLELNDCQRTIMQMDEQILQLKEQLIDINSMMTRSTTSSTRCSASPEHYCHNTRRQLTELRNHQLHQLGALLRSVRCQCHH